MGQPKLIERLTERGVIIPAPEAVSVRDVVVERIESGVVLHPGVTLRGEKTLLGCGTQLGRTGGGFFEDVRAGRMVDLYGGYFKDCVFLDGVIVRGHAEMRAGTLMEEESEAAHHVGYKMTVCMPWVIAGSLVNLCDALLAGGTGRADHTEIGSCLALYNFTPRGDKFASQFGDVPRGVFLRSPRIFIGGQTQIVSPVKVGYGAVLAAGCAVRRSVGEGQLYGEPAPAVDRPFDDQAYGPLTRLFRLTVELIGNLWALDRWYEEVREPGAPPFDYRLYSAAREQLRAGVTERVKRLDRIVAKLPVSAGRHLARANSGDGDTSWHSARVSEHARVQAAWPEVKPGLEKVPDMGELPGLEAVAAAFRTARLKEPGRDYLSLVLGLTDKQVAAGQADLQRVVDQVIALGAPLWERAS